MQVNEEYAAYGDDLLHAIKKGFLNSLTKLKYRWGGLVVIWLVNTWYQLILLRTLLSAICFSRISFLGQKYLRPFHLTFHPGLYMGHAKTAISLETEHFMHEFMSLLAWIANTLLFIASGIIIFDTMTTITEGRDDQVGYSFVPSCFHLRQLDAVGTSAIHLWLHRKHEHETRIDVAHSIRRRASIRGGTTSPTFWFFTRSSRWWERWSSPSFGFSSPNCPDMASILGLTSSFYTELCEAR